jgi:hypothetical protein
MTEQQREAQNGNLSPDEACARGLCWHCSAEGANYSAFGGEQITVKCPECKGNGKARP